MIMEAETLTVLTRMTSKYNIYFNLFAYLAVVIFLPLISQNGANDDAGVLDHHLASLDVPLAEKTATMNFRSKRGIPLNTFENTDNLGQPYRTPFFFLFVVVVITCKLLLLLWRFFPGV